MGVLVRAGFGALVLVACAAGCGGKVGDEGTPTPPTPTPGGSSSAQPNPPPVDDGGVAPRQVACKKGEASLGRFPGERAARVAVATTGVVVLSSRDGAGKVHVRMLRDAQKGLEDLGTHAGTSAAVAASGRRVAYADEKGVVVVDVVDGRSSTFAVTGSVSFVGLRETDVFVVAGAGLFRFPLAGGAAQPVCIGSTCTVPGIASFDVRGATLALVSTDGALYTGTDVGLRKVAVASPGPVAVGSGFVAFVAPDTSKPKIPSLGIFRPLEEEVELFPLPGAKGTACGPSTIEVVGLASDGARLAFNTKESYPCAESPQSLAFASRASRPETGLPIVGTLGAAAVAVDDLCAYALLDGADTSLGSFEAPAR